MQVSDQPLTAFGVRDDGAVLGCGTADGCCSVMQLSSALVEAVPNEKQTINAMFERETLRCGCLLLQGFAHIERPLSMLGCWCAFLIRCGHQRAVQA